MSVKLPITKFKESKYFAGVNKVDWWNMRASSRKLDEHLKLKGEKKTNRYYYIKLLHLSLQGFCISNNSKTSKQTNTVLCLQAVN